MTDVSKPARERPFLDRYFGLRESGSDVRTEFIAAVTTFLTMVYIVFVNPQILGNAGMDKGAVFVATCIAAAASTLVIVIVALNYRNILGATLIGILVVALVGVPLGLAEFKGIVSPPPSLAPTFLQLDFSRLGELTFVIIVFSFLMVDVFDNAGTLIGVAHRAGL